MISRRTIFSLLLALLIGISVYAWHLGHRDDCDRFGHGDPKATAEVRYGSATVVTPCQIWVQRQPVAVQGWCLLDLALLAMFAVSALYDVTTETRRRASFRGR